MIYCCVFRFGEWARGMTAYVMEEDEDITERAETKKTADSLGLRFKLVQFEIF
jgi:hypothetical protein